MKTVIRKGVFETNSSSTHSLSINGAPAFEEEASFELVTPMAKLHLLLGLIDNADNEAPKRHNELRSTILRFKKQAIKRYAELTGLSKKDALREIEYEAFAYTNLREIWDDEKKLKQYLAEGWHHDFAREWEKSETKDIVTFAHEFFYKSFEENKKQMRGKFRCDHYFANGCLDMCTCDFDSFSGIACGLGIEVGDTDEALYEKACYYLSDECRVLAQEYYCGVILEVTGDKY